MMTMVFPAFLAGGQPSLAGQSSLVRPGVATARIRAGLPARLPIGRDKAGCGAPLGHLGAERRLGPPVRRSGPAGAPVGRRRKGPNTARGRGRIGAVVARFDAASGRRGNEARRHGDAAPALLLVEARQARENIVIIVITVTFDAPPSSPPGIFYLRRTGVDDDAMTVDDDPDDDPRAPKAPTPGTW
jgi:hypothetical protein